MEHNTNGSSSLLKVVISSDNSQCYQMDIFRHTITCSRIEEMIKKYKKIKLNPAR